MTIRPEQLQSLEQLAEDKFTLEVVGHLRRHHPETLVGIPPDELLAQVKERTARAREYGLTGRVAITGFVALTYTVGPRFDLQPAIHAVLTDPAVTPDERVRQLVFRVQRLDWSEAARA